MEVLWSAYDGMSSHCDHLIQDVRFYTGHVEMSHSNTYFLIIPLISMTAIHMFYTSFETQDGLPKKILQKITKIYLF